MASKKSATPKPQKKQPKQINWGPPNNWKERIIDGENLDKIWKEILAEMGENFVVRSGEKISREWFNTSANGTLRLAKKLPSKKRSAPPTNSDNRDPSKRVIPKTAQFAPRPVAGEWEFGSLSLDQDNCFRHGNLTYTHDDIIREKSKDGWEPVYFYKEGIGKNVILFRRLRSDEPGSPLLQFEDEKEPQTVAKELMEAIRASQSMKSSMTDVVSYLVEEMAMPNPNKENVADGVFRFAHKMLMVLLEQGHIRRQTKKK